MEKHKRRKAEMIYLLIAGIFVASLVTSNLFFQKFFSWDLLGLYTSEISAGLIPYPATFLITDIVSEIYGKKRSNRIVLAALIKTQEIYLVAWRFRKYFGLKEKGAELKLDES